jgi:hypothetical protein
MRLHRQDEVPEDEYGLLCRQSRFAGVVRLVIWCGVLAIPPVFGWKFGKSWLIWTFVAVAAVVIPMALLNLAAMFRATNWLLRISSNGVWTNLRSYRDKDIDTDRRSVLYLDYAEIASIGRHTESYTTPSDTVTGPGSYGAVGGSTGWRDQFLEIQLNHDQTDELKLALNNLRNPTASIRSPVWVANPAVIRIGWVSGHGPAVFPRLAAVLTRLDGNVRVAEPTHRERPNWRNLTGEQVHVLASELVHVHGATLEATALLVRAGGMSYGDASTQIRQFEKEGIV